MASSSDADSRLRDRRSALGLTQVELSERSGVQQVTISALERRGPGRGVDQAIRLARALQTTVEALFAGEMPATPRAPKRRRAVVPQSPTGAQGAE